MWRVLFLACLLGPSCALAGQATGTISVGFTVLGPGNAPTIVKKAAPADATAVSSAQLVRKQRSGAPLVPRNTNPSPH